MNLCIHQRYRCVICDDAKSNGPVISSAANSSVQPTENETQLNPELARAVVDENDLAFDAQWDDWSAKNILACVPQDQDALRTVCRLWFGRGVAQGVRWGRNTNERVLARPTVFPDSAQLRSLSEAEQERQNLLITDD